MILITPAQPSRIRFELQTAEMIPPTQQLILLRVRTERSASHPTSYRSSSEDASPAKVEAGRSNSTQKRALTSHDSAQSTDAERRPLGRSSLHGSYAILLSPVSYLWFFFHRETDDVRTASALVEEILLQYLATCITCLALALSRS
jgi:hypothetical protein